MSERPIIKVDKDGKIRQTGKTRLKDGTIRVQPEGGMKFIKNKKDGGLMEAIEKVKAKGMEEGGATSDADREKVLMAIGETGATMSDAERAMLRRLMGRTANISDADQERMNRMIGVARRMEDGGAVPKKFKGFSKLPEAVQEKMNPGLAKKFEKGGPVKMGSGGGVCRGMGAARAGGKFKLR